MLKLEPCDDVREAIKFVVAFALKIQFSGLCCKETLLL